MLVRGLRGGYTGFFYGWVIVGVVFLILATTSGLGFYNASVILSAATRELDSSVGAVSGATGVFFAVAGLSGFLLSRWMDTVDIRLFFLAGGIVGASALYGLRWVDSVAELYVFFALFGVGFGLAGLVPGTTLVTRWFERRRSIALSVASTGLSVGGIAITPLAAGLIEDRGLAQAGSILTVAWLVGTIPLAVLFLCSRPREMGLRPDGDTAPANGGLASSTIDDDDDAVSEGASFVQAQRSRFYWGVCIAYGFVFFGQVGALAQLYNMAQERVDATTAAQCLSVLAFASVAARLAGGMIVTRFPTKPFTAVLILVQVLALVILAQAMTATGLVLGSIVFGMSIGNLLMLQPLLLAEAFGVAQYSRIYSFSQLIGTIGVAGGPFALGLTRDSFDYRVAFVVAALSSLVGFLALNATGNVDKVRTLWNTPNSKEPGLVS